MVNAGPQVKVIDVVSAMIDAQEVIRTCTSCAYLLIRGYSSRRYALFPEDVVGEGSYFMYSLHAAQEQVKKSEPALINGSGVTISCGSVSGPSAFHVLVKLCVLTLRAARKTPAWKLVENHDRNFKIESSFDVSLPLGANPLKTLKRLPEDISEMWVKAQAELSAATQSKASELTVPDATQSLSMTRLPTPKFQAAQTPTNLEQVRIEIDEETFALRWGDEICPFGNTYAFRFIQLLVTATGRPVSHAEIGDECMDNDQAPSDNIRSLKRRVVNRLNEHGMKSLAKRIIADKEYYQLNLPKACFPSAAAAKVGTSRQR
jgi:hypothetical protein